MKKRVAVIYGGCSSEHEISNQSAKAVLNHMDREKYDVIPIRISRERPLVSGPDEVELTDGWLDFEEKYQNRQNVKIHTQARISREDSQRIRQTVLHIYQTLRCSGIARVDMFLTPEGRIVFNEINTMPGLTVHSRYPKMLEASGIGFSEMIDRLIESAK